MTKYTSEEIAWHDMIQRCYNKKAMLYPYYGARGIKVCDEWRFDRLKFISDMGPKPSKSHSLDRIDNNKGYSAENCRWATKSEQVSNRRMLKTNKTGFTGVSTSWRPGKYRARVSTNGKSIYLGSFDSIGDAEETIRRYNNARR